MVSKTEKIDNLVAFEEVPPKSVGLSHSAVEKVFIELHTAADIFKPGTHIISDIQSENNSNKKREVIIPYFARLLDVDNNKIRISEAYYDYKVVISKYPFFEDINTKQEALQNAVTYGKILLLKDVCLDLFGSIDVSKDMVLDNSYILRRNCLSITAAGTFRRQKRDYVIFEYDPEAVAKLEIGRLRRKTSNKLSFEDRRRKKKLLEDKKRLTESSFYSIIRWINWSFNALSHYKLSEKNKLYCSHLTIPYYVDIAVMVSGMKFLLGDVCEGLMGIKNEVYRAFKLDIDEEIKDDFLGSVLLLSKSRKKCDKEMLGLILNYSSRSLEAFKKCHEKRLNEVNSALESFNKGKK